MAIAERWFLGGLSQTRATLRNRQLGMSLAALDIFNAASCVKACHVQNHMIRNEIRATPPATEL